MDHADRKMKFLANLSVFVIFLQLAPTASAEIVVNFTESASGVQVSGSGSLSLMGLTADVGSFVSASPTPRYRNTGGSGIVGGTTSIAGNVFADNYSVNSDLLTATFRGNMTVLGSDPNTHFGFSDGSFEDRVFVPIGYTAGDQIGFSVFNNGATLASFGLSDGDTWGATWLTGVGSETDSIMFNASISAVPEPGTAMFLVAITGVVLLTRRRRLERGSTSGQNR